MLHNPSRPSPHRSLNHSSRPSIFSPFKRALGRIIVAAVLAAATSPAFNTPAQHDGSRTARNAEEAFQVESDKLLRLVRRAAADDEAAARRGRFAEADSELAKLEEITDAEREADGTTSVNLTVELASGSDAELKRAGFEVSARVGTIATVETNVDKLPELAALASVRKMAAATYLYPVNERARQAVKLETPAGGWAVPHTGRGVIVGVIDSGIDFRHLDFTVPGSNGKRTRIKALLDMTVYSSQMPDPSWNYVLPGANRAIGRLHTEAEINLALQGASVIEQRDRNGHGTHVAATAAGNGLAGPTPGVHAGIAPEADLVIVKASRENDSTARFALPDTINAMLFIQQQAAELNKPFVINMSLGGVHLGPHDGSGYDERVIDEIVGGAPGRVVCVAAGNEGDVDIHAGGNVPAGGEIELKVDATNPYAAGAPVISPDYFELYYPTTDRFSITITRPDGAKVGPVSYTSEPINGAGADPYIMAYNTTDPQNGQHNITIVFKEEAKNLGGSWSFTLRGDDVPGGGRFDAWLGDGQFTTYVDPSRRITSPATSRGAITVGAYISRSSRLQLGSPAPFTSPGPTADGRPKPEISAPGYFLYSAKSADSTFGNDLPVAGDTFHAGALGTSMSSPVVAGGAALLLQANPNLASEQIKEVFKNTADRDGFTGAAPVWNARLGFGKINIAAALATVSPVPIASPNSIDSARIFVRQQYMDFLNREPDPSGLQFWMNQIAGCGFDRACIDERRVNTSAAFFLSTEFQNTGYLVHRFYKASFAQMPQIAGFMPDTQSIGRGVVVGAAGWQETIEANKRTFADAWVNRPAFKTLYDPKSNAEYVNALYANSEVTPAQTERDRLISNLNSGAETRASVLRKVAENEVLSRQEFNRAFVLMQYFGYLRRNPDASPNTNLDGYNFWLTKLNQFRGDYKQAEMVKAFIVSTEYRARFSQP